MLCACQSVLASMLFTDPITKRDQLYHLVKASGCAKLVEDSMKTLVVLNSSGYNAMRDTTVTLDVEVYVAAGTALPTRTWRSRVLAPLCSRAPVR